jgi:hypothetical protein
VFPAPGLVKRVRQVLLSTPLAVRVALTGPGVVDTVLIPMPDTPPKRRESLREALLVPVAFSALVGVIWLPAMWTHTLIKGDDLLYYWVFFVSPVRLWNPYVASGFPTAADPQTMSWYPVIWLFKSLGSWNAYALSPFVLAGCFTYGYVRSVTSSRLAGAVSGVGYALGGYMVGHFGHTSIEHAAAWLPLLIWSLESLAHRGRGWWLGVGAFAVASCCLSGHPQIFVYACFLAGAYALWRAFSAEVGPRRYLSLCAAALLLGIAIAAVQLALTAELVPHTVRSTASYEQFTWGSYPVNQWRTMLVPMLYGGSATRPYSGTFFQAELSSYQAGLVWMLALGGWASVRPRERGLGLFWAATAAVAILLCLGGNIPVLARLTYQVTPLAVFRAPVRHLMEFSFAMSVLAGLGAAGLKSGALSARAVRRVTWIVAMVAAAPVAAVLLAAGESAGPGAWRLFAEPTVLVACVLPVASAAVLLAWLRRRGHARVTAAVLGTMAVDLGTLTMLHHWPSSFVPRRDLTIPATASKYGAILATTHERLLTDGGGGIPVLPGNLASVWRVPGVTGYGPLQIARQAELLRVDTTGRIDRVTLHPHNQALDILAARYHLEPEHRRTVTTHGVSWVLPPRPVVRLGRRARDGSLPAVDFEGPAVADPIALAMVSHLSQAREVEQGTPVARFRVTHASGEVEEVPILAGRDTSEWAYDAPGPGGTIRHARARLFDSRSYLAFLPLASHGPVRAVTLEHVGPDDVVLVVEAVSWVMPNASVPLVPAPDPSRWRHVETLDGAVVRENRQALPRAWSVTDVRQLAATDVLRALQTSRFPGGGRFDARTTALLEEPPPATTEPPAAALANVRVQRAADTSIQLATSADHASFLVISNLHYPGWTAEVDGVAVRLYRVDYVLQGVWVPAGVHRVVLRYRPTALAWGGALSLSAVALTVLASVALARTPSADRSPGR